MFKFLSRRKERFNEITKPSLDNLSNLKKDFKTRLTKITANRKTSASQEVKKDFQALLNAWGMTEENIPQVISDLKKRFFLFFIFSIILIFTFLLIDEKSFFLLIIYSTILFICIFNLFTSLWRISILRNKEFKPFLKWFSQQFIKI